MAVAENLAVFIDLEEEEDNAGVFARNPSDVLCEVCFLYRPCERFIYFSNCGHGFCIDCVKRVFETNINESRVNLECLRCIDAISPNEVKSILDPEDYEKYLSFTLRKFLATQKQGACYCLSPDCPYACLNSCPDTPSNQVERNHFVCGREECRSEYCNSCKRPWHPDKTCEEVSSKDGGESGGISEELKKSMGAKSCPSCGVMIEKMSDGTCNQVMCSVCRTSFCWLCGKSVTEVHYMSPTGCPLYGTKMWTKRKKWCCRFWLWMTAPLIIILVAFLALPITLIIFPIICGYMIHKRCQKCHKALRVLAISLLVTLCVVLSPFVALLIFIIIFPLGLLYFYCFMPIHIYVQS